jgi:hypothetical protein
MRAACPALCLATLVAAVPLTESAAQTNKHLGVATCATSVCHGKLAPQPNKNVNLNEYRVWLTEDRHAGAFRILDSARSREMATKLGLGNARAAKICLDCHADNVPASLRGPKFQLSDGIGCEACHGGAEKWIETHKEASARHADNVARGMYPSEQPLARARLCVTCHVGARDRLATHAIMGAGHPRLRFELNVFSNNQPAHYVVDKDYADRKGRIEGANLWVTGQLESARRGLELLQSPLFDAPGVFPELAFYDCHSCHHPLKDRRWTAKRAGPGVRPGAVRLQKAHLVMLRAMAEALGSAALAKELNDGTHALVRAGETDAAAVKAASGALLQTIRKMEPWARKQFTRAEVAKIRKTLVVYAANDLASDYGAAEQIALGAESLSYALDDWNARKAGLDALFKAVESDSTFNPARFAEVARSVQARF